MYGAVDLSVILSAHNAEGTLGLAIKSTLLSMPQSSELLVCLHKCSDGSRQIAESIDDDRLKIFFLEEGGLADALNFLVNKSTGRFLARMDADDVCLPWRFRMQLKVMRRNPRIELLFSTAIIFGEAIKPLWIFPQYLTRLTNDRFRFLLTQTNPGVHPTLIARRDTLISAPYRDVPGEDLDLWLRIAKDGGRIERTRLPVILYRSHFNQKSRRDENLVGWQESDYVRSARQALNETRLLKLCRQSRRRFAIAHPLLTLEIIGFPSFGKIRKWLSP